MADAEDRGWWPIAWVAAVVALCVAGGVVFWRWRPGNVQGAATRIISLSRLAGKEYQPAISPDGETVAFLWQQEERRPPHIWILRRDDTVPKPLTTAPGEYSSPAWAPDGKSVACLRFRENLGEVVILPVAGGAERIVAPVLANRYGLTQRHLDWSADGAWIAIDDAATVHDPLSIFLISLKTGERKRITQPEARTIGDVGPRISPDGSSVTFIRMPNRISNALMTVPAGGGNAAAVVETSTHLISDQSWSPDGKSILFASNRDNEYRIWKTAAVQGATPQSTSVSGEFAIQFAVAHKPGTLIYAVVQDRINIWKFDLGSTSDPAARWKRVIASSGMDRSPQYSPDGRRIAFRSDRSGAEDIWVGMPDSDEAVLVTREHVRPSVPRWRPDGRGLVFHSAATFDIYVASEGADAAWTVKKFGGTGEHPVYSTDGQWIYAGATDAIVRYPSAGGKAEKIFGSRGISLGLSPDGKFLYFVREPKGTKLFRLDLGSRETSEVLDGLVPYCGSCWAPTNTGIYYLGTRPEEPNQQSLFYRDFAERDAQLIAHYPEPVFPIGIGPFSLSPDGRSFLCVRLDSSDSDLLRVVQFQ